MGRKSDLNVKWYIQKIWSMLLDSLGAGDWINTCSIDSPYCRYTYIFKLFMFRECDFLLFKIFFSFNNTEQFVTVKMTLTLHYSFILYFVFLNHSIKICQMGNRMVNRATSVNGQHQHNSCINHHVPVLPDGIQ